MGPGLTKLCVIHCRQVGIIPDLQGSSARLKTRPLACSFPQSEREHHTYPSHINVIDLLNRHSTYGWCRGECGSPDQHYHISCSKKVHSNSLCKSRSYKVLIDGRDSHGRARIRANIAYIHCMCGRCIYRHHLNVSCSGSCHCHLPVVNGLMA